MRIRERGHLGAEARPRRESDRARDRGHLPGSPAEAGGVDDTTTVVRVPASFTGEIEVHSDSGDVVATNVHGLAGLRASNRNGDVVAKKVSAAKLDAINENGDTLLSGVEAEAVLATNFNGDI